MLVGLHFTLTQINFDTLFELKSLSNSCNNSGSVFAEGMQSPLHELTHLKKSFLLAWTVFASATGSHTCGTFSLSRRLLSSRLFTAVFLCSLNEISVYQLLPLVDIRWLRSATPVTQALARWSETTRRLHKLSGMQKLWLRHSRAGERHWGEVCFTAPSHSLNQGRVCYQTEKHERVSLLSLWCRCFLSGWDQTWVALGSVDSECSPCACIFAACVGGSVC